MTTDAVAHLTGPKPTRGGAGRIFWFGGKQYMWSKNESGKLSAVPLIDAVSVALEMVEEDQDEPHSDAVSAAGQ